MAFPQKANCVAYWSFDASNSNDATPNANNGTDTATTYASGNGIISIGAGFNGTTSKIAIADSASFAFGTGSLSFSAWIKTSATAGSIWGGRAAGTGPQIGMTGGKTYTDGVGLSVSPSSTTSVNTGSWFHVVVVWDRANSLCRMYINGTQENTSTLGSTTATEAITKYIGDEGSPGSLYGKWNGAIDEVGWWNVALSAADVTSLYNGGAGVGYNSATVSPRLRSLLGVGL